MKDYNDIRDGVLLRLGLGREWSGLVGSYVRYCMMMWGRSVRDLTGFRVEEDFDIRMDLRYYRDLVYWSDIYRSLLRHSVERDNWGKYRKLLGDGVEFREEDRERQKKKYGYYLRNNCGRKSGLKTKKKVRYSLNELRKEYYKHGKHRKAECDS